MCKANLIFPHALGGCDTTSGLYGIGKGCELSPKKTDGLELVNVSGHVTSSLLQSLFADSSMDGKHRINTSRLGMEGPVWTFTATNNG